MYTSRISHLSIMTVVALALMLSARVSADDQNGHSGFLGDYSKLESHPDKDREGTLVYTKPDLSFKNYKSIYITFPHVQIKSDEGETVIDPRELSELAEYFHDKLIGALEEDYVLVDEPGSGVLILRTVIVDVEPINKTAGILGKLALKVVNLDVGQATIEAELLDGDTGEQLAALIETRGGDRVELGMAGAKKWGHAKAAFKQWAHLLEKRLEDFGMPTSAE